MGPDAGQPPVQEWEDARLRRREFLAGAALLGFGATLGGLGAAPSVAGAATGIDRNAVLKFSMSTTIPGLDPQKCWNGAAACGQAVIYESLLTIDPYSGKVQPLLASAMPTVTDHGLRYTFKLRPNVKFSNGMPVTSADVKFTWVNTEFLDAQKVSAWSDMPVSR